jgi:hypothetical protein
VTVADTSPFRVGTGTFNVTGGASQSDTASFAPTTYGPFTSSLTITGTNLCQPLPPALNLSGTGEAGGISITGTPTPFSVNCGATAATQQMSITNAGNQPMTWTGVLSSTGMATGTTSTGRIRAVTKTTADLAPSARMPRGPQPGALSFC